uniref:Putative secreted protein n=1 Tax=Anopheles marajoara TaxID=58244 RepID=A0A2M4C649_9DIPT
MLWQRLLWRRLRRKLLRLILLRWMLLRLLMLRRLLQQLHTDTPFAEELVFNRLKLNLITNLWTVGSVVPEQRHFERVEIVNSLNFTTAVGDQRYSTASRNKARWFNNRHFQHFAPQIDILAVNLNDARERYKISVFRREGNAGFITLHFDRFIGVDFHRDGILRFGQHFTRLDAFRSLVVHGFFFLGLFFDGSSFLIDKHVLGRPRSIDNGQNFHHLRRTFP